QAADRNQEIQEEVGKLIEAGIMKKVHYHDWLSNPVMVKNHDDSWRIDFHWTTEAEQAFKQMKQLIAKLPLLTAPMEKEELIVYMAATKETVSAVLMTEREAKQMPIYFVSKALRGPEINYTSMEKLVLALVHASKRLKRYFQVHPIIVITDQPIQQVLSRPEVAGRLQKWSIELGEYAIHYRLRVSVKGQILADFIVERPEEDSLDTLMEAEEELPELWILFDATNNEAEYEDLIAGMRIAEQMGVKNLQANVDSRLVANQVNGTYVAKEADMIQYLEKDNPFKDWCEKLCIRQHFAYVKHPQINGLVERANRSLGEGIKARLEARSKNWMKELPHVLSAHRTMIKSRNRHNSFALTYRTEVVIPAEIGMPTFRTAEVDLVKNNEALEINLDLLEQRREEATIHLVYRNNNASRAEDIGKLGPKWEGTYKVTEALGKGAYKLRDRDGKQLPRTWKSTTSRNVIFTKCKQLTHAGSAVGVLVLAAANTNQAPFLFLSPTITDLGCFLCYCFRFCVMANVNTLNKEGGVARSIDYGELSARMHRLNESSGFSNSLQPRQVNEIANVMGFADANTHIQVKKNAHPYLGNESAMDGKQIPSPTFADIEANSTSFGELKTVSAMNPSSKPGRDDDKEAQSLIMPMKKSFVNVVADTKSVF
ncbi:reverse transcriptase domain-containing protein, partial [Tanacetum coccineum]